MIDIARKLRIWYPGAIYHLMERGVRKQIIFQNDFDYKVFLIILKNELIHNKCILHAYCLMSNHFHLLLETGDMEIGIFMKALASSYAQYYNNRYSYRGHVFENRYTSCLIEKDDYFLQTSRYIHLNPVKAQMVSCPENYPWSSYRSILGIRADQITTSTMTLGYFGTLGRVGYKEFVESTMPVHRDQDETIQKIMGEDELWLP